jgi:flagellar biosynthesis protein FlhG
MRWPATRSSARATPRRSANASRRPTGCSRTPSRAAADVAPLEEFDALEEELEDFDGPRLRRSRMRRGIEIEQIAAITKINPSYLRFLEEERFGELPAPVYVRGFVSAYASSVGLDAKRVAAGYMKRFEANRRIPKRARFFD